MGNGIDTGEAGDGLLMLMLWMYASVLQLVRVSTL